MANLLEVAEINPRLDRSAVSDLAEKVSFVPMASVSEVVGAITSEEERVVSDVLKGFTAFQDRDVLVAKITPCFENGKIAHARIGKRLGFGSTEFHVIRPNAGVLDDRYLFHFVRQPVIREEGERRMTGSAGQKRVPKAFLESLDIPVPPLAEQRRIAAILDKADALRAKRREAIAKLDQLLQSVFIDMFGDPATNSKRLPTATLGDLGAWRSGGTPSRSNPKFFQGEIPWYSSGELNSPYVSRSNEHISDAAVSASAAKRMRPGSLMVGMYDTAAFKSSITTIPAACNQAVAFSLLDASKCETVYVYQALQVGKEHFKRLQRGVRQKNLNLSMIRETTIPLPPVAQQRKFAGIFAAVLGQHDSQRRYSDSMDNLFCAMQRQAFAGTL